jgi:Flp pilus assembly protein TadG
MGRPRGPVVRRTRREPGDGGFVAAWTVVIAVACWAMVGLVVDGGRVLRERSSAFGAASAAARAGVQEIDERAAVQGEVRLAEDQARTSALAFLRGRGLEGAVEVDGLDVTVTVTGATDLLVLGPGSIDYSVTATARAVQGGGPV